MLKEKEKCTGHLTKRIEKEDKAILILDKENDLVDIFSDDFQLDDSKVNFLRRC